MDFFNNIVGTISSIFQISSVGPKLKKISSSYLQIRNSADLDFATLGIAEPLLSSDAVTKNYADTNVGLRVIGFSIGTATQSSVGSLPANSVVFSSILDIGVAYTVGTTISIGIDTDVTLFQTTVDNNTEIVNAYEIKKISHVGGASKLVKATITGALSGSGYVYVFFANPIP